MLHILTYATWYSCIQYSFSCSERWCTEEDNWQATTCSQFCDPHHLQRLQVLSTRASLAGCRQPGLVQSVCPGVQVSTQHCAWIPIDTLGSTDPCPAFLAPSPMLGLSWQTGLPLCQSGHVREMSLCLCRSCILELSAWQSQEHYCYSAVLMSVKNTTAFCQLCNLWAVVVILVCCYIS